MLGDRSECHSSFEMTSNTDVLSHSRCGALINPHCYELLALGKISSHSLAIVVALIMSKIFLEGTESNKRTKKKASKRKSNN